jgi:hypothetical protein
MHAAAAVTTLVAACENDPASCQLFHRYNRSILINVG